MESKSKKIWLSEHFTLEELTYSRTAVEHAIDNTPSPEAKVSLQHLTGCLLEPLRQLYKKPIAVLSGYRNKEVNRLVGGVSTSQHLKGEAADCYTPEGPAKLLELLLQSGLPFDQAILYKRRKFLHLSLKTSGKNRMQVILCMLCVIFLLAGCGARRTVAGTCLEERRDSVHVSLRDSLIRVANLEITDSLSWELEQVVYLPLPPKFPASVPGRIHCLPLQTAIRNMNVLLQKTSRLNTPPALRPGALSCHSPD